MNREDFEVAVVMLFGYKLSEVEVDSIMSSVRPGNSGILFEKFLNLMSAKKSAQLHSDETREIFTAFDMQDRGFLTFEDFKKTINSVLPKLSERIIIEAFREVDQDSDGCISFKEFECAMKHGQDEVSPLYFAWRMLSGEKTKWKLQISSYLKINETSFVSASILRTLTVSVALKNSLWSFTVDKLGVLIYMCMCA